MAQDQLDYLIQEFREHRAESTKKMDAILVQTTKTNGRVSALEDRCDIVFEEVDLLKTTSNEMKGSNKIIANIWKAAGAITLILIAAFLSYYSAKK